MRVFIMSIIFCFTSLCAMAQRTPAEEIYRIVKYSGYSDSTASYWVKVAKMETGYFTSKRFKQDNNPWGMKYAYKRDKTCMKKGASGFAVYCTKNDGYWDIVLYMKARDFPKHFNSLKEFTKFLKSKYYFEEPFVYYYGALFNIK